MQVEDPRIRYKQLQNERCSTESIPMQPLHGSPYHVYPASNFPAVKAFQGPNPSLQSVSASPLLSTKSQIQMEMSPLLRQGSPLANLPRRQTIQETSFSNNIDTDAVVAKINNMFPTASDNHIRLLLKKYYNREAVVISALQVEKHPVTMPGPYATPPSQRHLFHSNSAFQMTPPTRRIDAIISRTGSPIPGRPGSVASGLYGSPRIGDQMRNSPKPHSSPKMKLRYLKNVFPKADETLLLDVLANADNNVQTASEKLIGMGYTKRDVAPPRLNYRVKGNEKDDKREQEKIIPLHPKVLTAEQKTQIKARLEERYKNIAERIISMALESVNFSEDRAIQILQIVQQEDETKARKDSAAEDSIKENDIIPEESQPGTESSCNRDITSKITSDSSSASQTSASQALSSARAQDATESTATTCFVTSTDMTCYLGGNQGDPPSSSSSVTSTPTEGVKKTERTRYRDKSDSLKNSPRGSTEEDVDSINKTEFKSLLGRVNSKGHDNELVKGPDDSLLLADYVTWNGANPDISLGRKGIANGSDPALICERNANARGHNPELCKGPNVGLAKGSIYSQLNRSLTANVKCN